MMDIGDYKQATEFFIGAPLANIGVQKYSFLFGWIVENIKLRHLLHCLDARNMKLKTTAVVLDSSPGRASLEGGSHFVTVGIKNSVARFIARNGVYVAYRMYVAINAGFSAVGLPFKDMSKHSIEIAAPCAVSEKNPDGNVTGRRLFLCSDEDKMCQVHEIQERIEVCKAEGIAVEEMMFIGSEHVKHAVVHREE
ncbi:hypothetical protein BJ741DRAFT_715696 [Chytriomyces cf. hyalinus JEL632]|nr:hypothetical protein BJ741DRAFT_715696 [Chytriomyces cf. hyalinus JEL632]